MSCFSLLLLLLILFEKLLTPEETPISKRRTGTLVGNFEKNPLRGTKILFCWCGLKCFPPLHRSTNSETTHYLN